MFQSMEAPLILFLVILLLVGPILGIIAFVGMRRLDEAFRRQNPQELIARLDALEQRLAKLEKAPQTSGPTEPSAQTGAISTAFAPGQHPPVPPPPMPATVSPIPPMPSVPSAKPREAAPPPPPPGSG